jgi:hypothetical protein
LFVTLQGAAKLANARLSLGRVNLLDGRASITLDPALVIYQVKYLNGTDFSCTCVFWKSLEMDINALNEPGKYFLLFAAISLFAYGKIKGAPQNSRQSTSKAMLVAGIGALIVVTVAYASHAEYAEEQIEICGRREQHCQQTCLDLTVKYTWNADQKLDCNSKCRLVRAICATQVHRDGSSRHIQATTP